jgi:hypothetical protein
MTAASGAIGGAHRRWLPSATVQYPQGFFFLWVRHKTRNLPRGSLGGGGDRSRACTVANFLQTWASTGGGSKDQPAMKSGQMGAVSFVDGRGTTVRRGKAFSSAAMVVVKARVSSFISMKNRSRTTPFIRIFFVLVLDVDSTSTCVPF